MDAFAVLICKVWFRVGEIYPEGGGSAIFGSSGIAPE